MLKYCKSCEEGLKRSCFELFSPFEAPEARKPQPKLRDVLKAAKPSWTEKDLSAVVEKLLKAKAF